MTNYPLCAALFAVIILVTGSNTLPLMASPYIVGLLGGSNDIAFYTVTFYSIGNVLGVPIGKNCVGKIRPASFFLFFITLFALFSCACAFCPTYPLFIICRFFQGIAAGTLFPMASQALSLATPKENSRIITAIVVTIFTVIPTSAAALGGWISYDYDWSYLFFGKGIFLFLLGFYLYFKLGKAELAFPKVPFDGVGFLFYILAILPLAISLTLGQQLDWLRSPLIVSLIVMGVIFLGFFIIWELKHPFPILDFKLLKTFAFSFALLNLAIIFSAYFGMILLLSYWLKLWVSYTPIWIGLILGVMALAGFVPVVMLGSTKKQLDCRIPLGIALVLLAFSCFYTMHFNVEINLERIAYSRAIAGFGLAFFLPPLFRLCFHTFPEGKVLSVIGYFQLTRMLACGLGAALYLTLWQRRDIFFHSRLGQKITASSSVTQDYFAKAKEIDIQGMAASEELNNLLSRQSVSLALDDCFYLMGYIFIALFFLLLLTYAFRIKGFLPETK